MENFERMWSLNNFKMDTKILLSLCIAVITFVTPAAPAEPRVVCYYTNWSVYRPGTAKFNPQNINPYLCTHLIYAFGGFTKENSLKPFDKYQDVEKGGYAKFTGLKTYNKNLKTLLAIGGWNEGSSRFSPMVASRERRKEFVRNAIKFLRQNRFDGLDLDWEYPAFRDGGKPKDRENYAKLVKELREEFDREAQKTGKPRLLLTMAVPAGIEYIQKGFDVETLNRYLDWMNLLSYDYHSAFEPAVNHHAPLYPLEEPNEYSVDNELNIDYTIKFYLESGADPNKIVLGIPTYGRSYTLFNADAVEIGSPADGPGQQGDATREKGYLAYYEICEALKPKSKKRNAYSDEDSEEYSEEEEDEEPWTVVHPNADAMGPVAYKGNQWVGYDDIDIVKKKAEYAAENGLGGIMFWSIDNDDFRGTCHGKPFPLIEAAKEAYYQKAATVDENAIQTVTRKAQSSNKGSSNRRKNRPKPSTTTTTSTTPKPAAKSNKRGQTTPAWNITPEPPTTPDPGTDFKCEDEGFYPHPRDCKKYFWCLDSGPSNLGIVAHQFTCPSGLYFNKAADSCDFSRNVLCKKPAATTKAPTTKPSTTTVTTTTTTTTRRPVRVSTRNSILFRSTTRTTTPEPETEEEYEEDVSDDNADPSDTDAEDPKVIKELIDLIKKVGGIEQLEKQLHLGEAPVSTDGGVTTTQSSFNKKLYQKVLERTKGRNKFGGNNIFDNLTQNSRRGPQNEGIEPTADKDKLLKKDKPQYTTINRQRSSTTSTTEEPLENDETDSEADEPVRQVFRSRAVESEITVATTTKPLQYVNIRRPRPTSSSTSDTADDSASRNALFERPETYVSVSDSPNTLDIASARRENIPEYVTIRRQRPATEETTTLQYDNSEDEEEETERSTALESEISSQPKYTSILRTRSTTVPPTEQPSSPKPVVIRTRPTTPTPEKPNSPEPTTVLAVQISSFLNALTSEIESPEPPTTIIEIPETTTTTTTTTTTAAPPSNPTRRTILRRRGSTSTTSSPSTASLSTQVSQRNYAFVRRRITRPNEISDSDIELSRKIRSTTPDSREIDNVNPVKETGRKFTSRFRFQSTNDDSVPAAASQIARDQLRSQVNLDELLTLTPVDVEPQFVPRQSFNPRNGKQFSGRTTPSDSFPDSEVSAAEVSRPNILPRGRGRFNPSSTTETSIQAANSESTAAQRRPTFARFSPRPFARNSISTTEVTNQEQVSTQRITSRFQFGRTRPAASPLLQARNVPFQPRVISTQKPINDNNDEPEIKVGEDITLSESERQEKEHEDDVDEYNSESKTKTSYISDDLELSDNYDDGDEIKPKAIETTTVSDLGKRKFRVIRRRPTSTTLIPDVQRSSLVPPSTPKRIRKIIRKKLKTLDEQEIIAKSVAAFDAAKETTTSTTTTEYVLNYGEKTRATVATSTTNIPITTSEQVTLVIENNSPQTNENVVIFSRNKPEPENQEENQESLIIAKTEESVKEPVQEKEIFSIKLDKKETPVEITTVQPIEENSQADIKSNDENIEGTSESYKEETENKDVLTTESLNTETEEARIESTTTSRTQLPSSVRTRSPYRPQKKVFTSTTQSSFPSSSRTFSRKYNPGVYTSPSTITREPFKPSTTRRQLSSRLFTRKPSTTAKTTQKPEDDYTDDEILEEEPEEDPLVLVPINQLFTRKPDSEEYENTNDESDEILEEEEDIPDDEPSNSFIATTKKAAFKPRVINSNTFRTSTSTTEIPKRLNNNNRTGIFTRFSSNKPVSDTKKRVQNVPVGYNISVVEPKPSLNLNIPLENQTAIVTEKETTELPTTVSAVLQTENESTGISVDDDYLSMTEATSTIFSNDSRMSSAISTNTIEIETATAQMEVNNNTDDYLVQTEGTTNIPSTESSSNNAQTIAELDTTVLQTTLQSTALSNTESASESPETTSQAPVTPIIKTQFNKLFSVSRIVEVSSKQDKHRLNKNNETTLIEEGQIKVEKKPIVDQIGEVSRFSLIKIFEDEIPIYLTKLGHVYPVDNPPDNPIRIDEARNARALVSFVETAKENLVASESINEAYRHVKRDYDKDPLKDPVEHLPNDDFLSYVNDEKATEKPQDEPLFSQWQFVPAAYENEQNKAKRLEIVTPRSMLTNPSTLPLEGLFKTENPIMARKVAEGNQPFVVYSASIPMQEEKANIVQLSVLKPETGRSIVTFAKGQEFNGASVEETTIKYPAPKRSFQRRTKATSPPEVEETTTPNTDNTNIFTSRGGSKFKIPKVVEKSSLSNKTSEVENGGKPLLNGGARRNEFERPAKRGFVRRRQGGANAISTTTQSTTSVSTTLSSVPSSTRRGFRIASRKRVFSTPRSTISTSTTTTPAPTTTTPAPTTTEFIEESVQDIGDTDAIEEPSLEPGNSKKMPKIQRRPLLTLKDTNNDQNPSATNEEENKRQNKKYSATFRQNQLESFLKAMTTEGATTDLGTTAEELGPETALAIAAFKLLTAPVPSTEVEDSTKPIKSTQTTQEYKFTNTDYTDFTNSRTPNYEDSIDKINTGRPNYSETPTYLPEIDTPNIASSDYETPNPTSFDVFPTKETTRTGISTLTIDYDTPRLSTYEIPKPTYGFPPRNTPSGFSLPPTDYDERSTRIPTIETTRQTLTNPSKTPRRFTYSTVPDEIRIPNDETTRQVSTSRGFMRPSLSTISDESSFPTIETTRQTFTNPISRGFRRPTISTISAETEIPSSKGFRQPTISTILDETEIATSKDFRRPTISTSDETEIPSSKGFRRPTISTISDETEIPTSKSFRRPTISTISDETEIPTSKGFKRPTISTISDEPQFLTSRGFKRPTISTISDETEIPTFETTRQISTNPSSKGSRRLTISTIPEETPSIATLFDVKSTEAKTVTEEYYDTTRTYDLSTLSLPKQSTTLGTPRSTSSGFRSRQRFSSPNIIRPGYSGVSPIVLTEKYATPDNFGYSTAAPMIAVSNQDPSLYTRDYLLESPVTKAYDEEYQYLLPATSPQPSTRRIRKKLQRKISTTLRPTISYSSTESPTEKPSSTVKTTENPTTTTEKPRRTSNKKAFEKIAPVPPSRTFRPIVNYDYYDDSEEKVVEKYAEGTKVVLHGTGSIECLDIGNFPHPMSCKKFISCARMESGAILGWEYICPKGLSFDPVGGICNWSAGLGCVEKEP